MAAAACLSAPIAALVQGRLTNQMSTTAQPVRHAVAYNLTMDEVTTIKWALLVLRAHWSKATVELSTEEIVALENRLFWPAE